MFMPVRIPPSKLRCFRCEASVRRRACFILSAFALCLAATVPARAQQQGLQHTVEIGASVQLPADAIFLTIRLHQQAESARKAFQNHRALEDELVDILGQFSIPDSSITYSLLDLNQARAAYGKNKPTFETRQTIVVRLNSLDQYEPFQVRLLDAGIYGFRAQFWSDRAAEANELALAQALAKARAEVEQVASALGKRVGRLLEVKTRGTRQHQTVESGGGLGMTVQGLTAGEADLLSSIPHYVAFTARVTTVYELLDE